MNPTTLLDLTKLFKDSKDMWSVISPDNEFW